MFFTARDKLLIAMDALAIWYIFFSVSFPFIFHSCYALVKYDGKENSTNIYHIALAPMR